MALYYAHRSRISFIAKWWWQLDGAYINPFNWKESAHLIKPLWVRFGSGDGEDGYLRVESEPDSLVPGSDLVVREPGVLYDTFWFGAYEKNGRFYYQIRPIKLTGEEEPIPLTRYLDSDLVGYMGMYQSWSDAPEWVIYNGSELWQLRGADLMELSDWQRICNLEITDISDNPVTLRYQSARPYLYTGSQKETGRVTLEIVRAPASNAWRTREGQ